MEQRLKPERIQDRLLPVTPERLQQQRFEIGNWQVDPTPNAISRHFPQPSFADSATFLDKVAAEVEKHGTTPFAWVDASGVTLRLGNPPSSVVKCKPGAAPLSAENQRASIGRNEGNPLEAVTSSNRP